MPPTGRKIAVPATSIYRVANGKITEDRPGVDMMAMLEQLGAAPSPVAAG